MTSKYERLRWITALSAIVVLLGCTGADGPPGPKGDQGPPGAAADAGATDSLTNDVTGSVTDGTSPLQGVLVTAAPGGAKATTDAKGAFTLGPLEIGAYALTFHLAGYLDQTVTEPVSLAAPTTVSVVLVANAEAGVGPSLTVADQLLAGYATAVTIPAVAAGTGPFTYAWTQTRGPAATLTGADTATLSFTTQDFLTSIGPVAVANARFDTLGIDPDQALDYQFQLVVTDAAGNATTTTVTVNATRPTIGLRMAPLGVPVWMQGNGPIFPLPPVAPATVGVAQTSWSWTLDTTGAPGSTATITNPSSQFPSFVPDVTGTYKVTETVSNQTMNVYGGTWEGEMTDAVQSVCLMCHGGGTNIAPDVFPPWKKTKHYSALQSQLEGADGAGFGPECLSCHVVGFDKTAANNGFDDVEPASGWTFPATLKPGNWSTLVQTPKLGQLAGIQCENCHGPQNGGTTGPHANATNLDINARINWGSSVCASCHQEAPFNYTPSQWAEGGHANLSLAVSEGAVEKNASAAHCGRCHTAQGYARYAAGLNQGYYAYLTNDGKPLATGPSPANHVATATDMLGFGMGQATVQSQTCPACHDPHDATNPVQLRVYDATAALPNGLTNVSGMGAGMVCLTCHNSRNGEHTDFATQTTTTSGLLVAVPGPTPLTSFGRGPHSAAQGDVVFGFNAYFGARYNPSPHLAVADSCAGCHYAAATASDLKAKQTTNHSFVVDNTICSTCHSAGVDGVAFEAANKVQLDGLRGLWAAKLLTTLNAAFAAPGATFWARAYDPASNTYSSAGAGAGQAVYDVTLTAANGPITAVAYAPIGTSTQVYGPSATAGITLTLSTPIPSITFVNADGSTNNVQTNVTHLTVGVQTTGLYLAGANPAANPTVTPFSAPTAVPANVQILYKAYWNLVLLNNDNTFGVHNPPFYTSVFTNTSAQLAALP